MASYNQKAVDRLLHPIEGEKIAIRDLMTDEGERTLVDFGTYDYITKKALDGFAPADVMPVVYIEVDAGEPDVYTLDATQLANINLYTRFPNFLALIGGIQFNDIIPTYTGGVRSFTSVTVQLHSAGSLNVEDTILQFS